MFKLNKLPWLIYEPHVRKPDFCICENKDADQLRGNHEADQRLCFRYTDSTIPLVSKSEISGVQPSSVTAQPGLCGTWSEEWFSQNEAHMSLATRKPGLSICKHQRCK